MDPIASRAHPAPMDAALMPDAGPIRPRVAVINDYPEFCELVEAILSDAGYDVFAFVSSATPPSAVLATRPHLLILDLTVHEAAGGPWDLTKVRAAGAFRDIPIVLTSADLPRLRERGLAIARREVTILLEKPFELDELLGAVEAGITAAGPLVP